MGAVYVKAISIGVVSNLLTTYSHSSIIEKKDVYIGWDRERMEELVDKYLRMAGY
jgi:hypothetical protein